MNATFKKVRIAVIEKRPAKAELRVLALASGNSEQELIELAARAIMAAMMLRKMELSSR